jgi:tRNA threonylcarbamoyladenosine biosynthesis protein TsaB
LDVVAAAVPLQTLPLAAVLQAGRTRVAVVWYQAAEGGWQAQGPAQTMTVDELAESIHHPTLVAGELSADDRQRLARKRVNVHLQTPAQSVRRPSILAELAWQRFEAGHVDDLAALAPIYLRTEGTPL